MVISVLVIKVREVASHNISWRRISGATTPVPENWGLWACLLETPSPRASKKEVWVGWATAGETVVLVESVKIVNPEMHDSRKPSLLGAKRGSQGLREFEEPARAGLSLVGHGLFQSHREGL